jgi:DNA polymerase I-like protein with 3'-5' exonuclease and polymerase domains
MFRNPFDAVVHQMDFSQIEAQCAVHRADENFDANNFDANNFDLDPYVAKASEMLGVPPANITPAMRKAVKERLYCRLYGGS